MKEKQLRRLMRLSRSTDTPLIVADGDESFVLMGIDRYEELMDEIGFDDDLPEEFYSDDDVVMEELSMSPEEIEPPDLAESIPDEPSEAKLESERMNEATAEHLAVLDDEVEATRPKVRSAVEDDPFLGEEEQFYLEPID